MNRAIGLAILLFVSSAGSAHAGGLARPNAGSPTAAGMAGAWAAIADDASALYVNPAGIAFATPGGLASVELVVAPRSYVCEGTACGTDGPPPDGLPIEGKNQDATAVAPAPVLGLLFKPGGEESPLTLGVAAYNSFGGILHWDKFESAEVAALNGSTEVVFEVAVGAGYQVDERVSLGAAIRVGIGLFGVDASKKPADTELSALGVGVGLSAGILVKPTDKLSVGLGWRSNLDITTSGSGTIIVGTAPMDVDAEHVQRWPQSASLSAAFKPQPALVLALQLDWTQWSRFEALDIHFPGNEGLDQHFPLDWSDTFTVRAGSQYQLNPKLQVRGGLFYDGNAVPDRTIERQYLDAPKFGLAGGGSYVLSKRVLLDLGFDAMGGPARKVPETDLADVPASWAERRNIAPGEHQGSVFTLATGVRIAL